MNINPMRSWLLVICIIIGRLTTSTQGADLKWYKSSACHKTEKGYEGHQWALKLLDVPSRDQASYEVTLYEQKEDGTLVEIDNTLKKFENPPKEDSIWIPINVSQFQAKSPSGSVETKGKVVAKVVYPDGVKFKSETLDLAEVEANDTKAAYILGGILGGIFGGIVLLLLVLYCCCHKQCCS